MERITEPLFLDQEPAKEVHRIVGYRMGLYDPDPGDPRIFYIGRMLGTDDYDQAVIQAAMRRFAELTDDDLDFSLCLAAFPVEE